MTIKTTDQDREREIKYTTYTVRYARTNIIGSRTSFVIALFVLAYTEIYAVRGNPLPAHSLQQSYHPTQPFTHKKCNAKSKIYVKII